MRPGDIHRATRPDTGGGICAIAATPDNQQFILSRRDAALMAIRNPLGHPADFDGDGDVDLGDVSVLLTAFGVGTGGDPDGDGDTDLADLSALVAGLGAGFP